jgi:hypothetical protein
MTAPVRGLHPTHSLAAAAHSAQVQAALTAQAPHPGRCKLHSNLKALLVMTLQVDEAWVCPGAGAVNATSVATLLPADGTVSAVTC